MSVGRACVVWAYLSVVYVPCAYVRRPCARVASWLCVSRARVRPCVGVCRPRARPRAGRGLTGPCRQLQDEERRRQQQLEEMRTREAEERARQEEQRRRQEDERVRREAEDKVLVL